MKRDLGNLLLAGLLLATLEVSATLVRGHALFLSVGEQLQYALTVLAASSSCTLSCGLLLRAVCVDSRRARAGRGALALVLALLAALLSWQLTTGRLVHDAWWRVPAVLLLGALVGGVGWLVLNAVARRRAQGALRLPWFVASALLAALALFLTITVLPRSYPAFHLGLLCGALLTVSVGALSAPTLWPERFLQRTPAVAALLLALAPYLLWRLASHPTLSFAVHEKAPWTAKLMAPFAPAPRPPRVTSAQVLAPRPSEQRGVDLRDRDVLLISVDALRADLLRAYGGRGATPELDRLAAESTVFLRAYTPAPHTSYALASLLTGKFVKPLIELGHELGDPPTLPDRLRRYGYRTAAFYPPAIFFVDGASFEPLQQRGFGFEYRKEMFASADERIAQIDAYLAEADVKRPLFVWVHLFEPHEPYAPPAGVDHDNSERGRYEAEVATCDRAIAELVRRFRAARPKATVIVTADHGEEFGDHGGSFHGTSLYDEQVRVPLLWSSPGVVSARTTAVPVELTDLGTTLLSTAGIPRDAHMRGDDLGAVLAGRDEAGPSFAFASIEGRHMVTDGKRKLICAASDAHCALFELERDPAELRNAAGALPAEVERLRGALDAFLGSIARAEAVTVSQGVSLPDVLARAKLGATVDAVELLPLLDDARAAVRSESARVLGELGEQSALPRLTTARQHDADEEVRAEASIAAAQLGDPGAVAAVLGLLAAPGAGRESVGRARRAALALARSRRVEAVPVLAELAVDEQATESDRLRAVRALGGLGSALAVPPLIATLAVVRLREASAQALALLGGPEAVAALHAQLVEERYPPARGAEAAALLALGDPGLAPLVRRYLGMQSSLPHGVRVLGALSALTPASRQGALLADPSVRRGRWTCGNTSCAPEAGAQLVLPRRGAALRGPVRVTLWFQAASPGAALLVDGVRLPLSTTEHQLSFERPSSASAERFELAREGDVSLLGVTVLPSLPEIPPPPPLPWKSDAASDAGAPSSASEPAR